MAAITANYAPVQVVGRGIETPLCLRTRSVATRLTVLVGLAAVTLLSWAYMFYLGWQMNQMDMGAMNMGDMGMEMAMPQTEAWTTTEFLLTFVMWAVMMVAMMIPSAAPMITTYAAISRKRDASRQPFGPTVIFVLGYLIVWTAFSLLATTAQWGLHSAALLSPMMVTTSAVLGAGLLIAAGVFQLHAAQTCLLASLPVPAFVLPHRMARRQARRGALQMGAKAWNVLHGLLLVPDGVAVRGGRNESALGRRTGRARAAGEGIAGTVRHLARAGVGFIVWGLWLAAGSLLA